MSGSAGIQKTRVQEDDLEMSTFVNVPVEERDALRTMHATLNPHPLAGLIRHHVIVKNKGDHQIIVFQSHVLPLKQLAKFEAGATVNAPPVPSAGLNTLLEWATKDQRMTKVAIPSKAPADERWPSAVFRTTSGPVYITIQDPATSKYHCCDYTAEAGDVITVSGAAVLQL